MQEAEENNDDEQNHDDNEEQSQNLSTFYSQNWESALPQGSYKELIWIDDLLVYAEEFEDLL